MMLLSINHRNLFDKSKTDVAARAWVVVQLVARGSNGGLSDDSRSRTSRTLQTMLIQDKI